MLSASFLEGRRVHLERKYTKVLAEIADLETRIRDGVARHEERFLLLLKQEIASRIRAAMQRIMDGSYGNCLRCDGQIPETRLERMPDAPVCIPCSLGRQRC